MSLLPLETRNVSPYEAGEPYDLHGGQCSVPGCTNVVTDEHHLWRRSFLAGAYDWVLVDERVAVPNKVGLCHDHHMELDSSLGGQRAFVVGAWVESNLVFFWLTKADVIRIPTDSPYTTPFMAMYALAPQYGKPLVPQPGPQGDPDGRTPVGTENASGVAMQTTITGEEKPHAHVVNERGVEKPCSKCRGTGKVVEKPKPELEQAPERRKTTWSVRVPKDEREDGYEVLEALVEGVVDKLADAGLIRDRNKGANYYAMVYALRYFVAEVNVDEELGE